MPATTLRPARPEDVPAIVALLESHRLPAEELEEHLDNVVVGERDGRLVACGGIETYPGASAGLVRSMAVDAPLQHTGLGDRIMRWLLERAEALGLQELYLFTMTAAGFYERFGFARAALEHFPEALRSSWQYRFVQEWGARRPEIIAMRRPLRRDGR